MNLIFSPNHWSDPALEEKPQEIRHALTWINTNQEVNLNMLGLFSYSPRRFAFQTGLNPQWLQRTLEDADLKDRFIVFGRHVLIKNFIREQFVSGPGFSRDNVVKGLRNRLLTYPPDVQEAVCSLYPDLKPFPSPSQALAHPSQALANTHKSKNGIPSQTPETSSTHTSPCQALTKGHEEREEREVYSCTGESEGRTGPTKLRVDLPQTVEEVIAYGATLRPPKPEAVCRQFWSHYEGQAKTGPNGEKFWVTGSDTVVTNWKAKLEGFQGFGPSKKTPAAAADITAELHSIRSELQWQKDPERLKWLKKRRDELEGS